MDLTNIVHITNIEIQGCNTAEDPHDSNNLSAAFSRHLYNSGKIKSYVIGHTTQ
jgi:hypothetical protein